MGQPLKETIYQNIQLERIDTSIKREEEDVETYKDRILKKNEQKEQYKARVKGYTHFIIGRKIPENMPTYHEK